MTDENVFEALNLRIDEMIKKLINFDCGLSELNESVLNLIEDVAALKHYREDFEQIDSNLYKLLKRVIALEEQS